MEIGMSEPVIDILCAPLAGGQAVLELAFRQLILEETDLYNRKRRLRHTFFVRADDRIAKFEIIARVSLLPARISIAELQILAAESLHEDIKETAREAVCAQVPETDPEFEPLVRQTMEKCLSEGFEERVAYVVQRLLNTYTRDGVIIEGI